MNSEERNNRSLERRRELNRQAAQKLRNRQKEKAVVIKQEYFAAQSKNTQLNYEVKQLRRFKEELDRQITGHLPVCHKTHYHQSASMSALSATTSQPVQYFQSFPSGQLVPLSFNNQVVSYDMTPSGVQVLTITPVGPAETDGDITDSNAADSSVANASDAVDDNAAENRQNDNGDNISDVSEAEQEQSEPNAESNTDTAANVEVTETVDQPPEPPQLATKQETVDIQKQNDTEHNAENARADDEKKKIVKSPRTSSRATRAIPPRSHSPIERVTRHAARKHAPPVKRGGKASVTASAPTEAAAATVPMDVDSNLPVTVSALSEDD